MKKNFSPLFMSLLVLAGCAKEAKYEEVYKPEVKARSSFFTANENGFSTKKYLYVPMTMGTPRKVKAANPFYQGGTKLVKLKWAEKGIEVVEMEKDERFSENDLNHNPVLLIPGEYKKFGCKEDANGDCSNAEEEVTDLQWYEKTEFEENADDLEVRELNELDLYNIDGSGCVTQEAKRVVKTEVISDEVYNIEIEKTYKVKDSWNCIRDNYLNDELGQSSFKVRFFYSLVALDKLASPNYEPLNYPKEDHSIFGYFKSESSKLDGSFDSSRPERTYFANRWNPNKTELTYYLSASYSNPKNAHILEATMNSLKVMNKNLAKSGAKFRLKFVTQTKENEKSPGDLRYSSIVLIDDPLANGLLGYAPSVKNPETGEIVQSHINMYGGVLASGTRWTYEQAVDIMEEQYLAAQNLDTLKLTIDASALYNSGLPTSLVDSNVAASGVNQTASTATISPSAILYPITQSLSNESVDLRGANNHVTNLSSIDRSFYFDQLMSGTLEAKNDLNKRVMELDKEHFKKGHYSGAAPEFFPIAGTVKVIYPKFLAIKDILNKKGILKRWKELNKDQQEQIKRISVVHRYTSTLVHEMGHSLGLRHNFAGSTDKANFYSDEETTEILSVGHIGSDEVKTHKAPTYSSVMDYAASDYNELASFGKYDVAALQYAYSGKLNLDSGANVKVDQRVALHDNVSLVGEYVEKSIISYFKELVSTGLYGIEISSTEELTISTAVAGLQKVASLETTSDSVKANILNLLKSGEAKAVSYTFCTDENAGTSTTCNRFDEGTDEAEVTKYLIERYKSFYKYRNFRDGREDFNTNGMGTYIVSRFQEFGKMRDVIEDYESFIEYFGAERMKNGCTAEDVTEIGETYCGWVASRRQAVLDVADAFIEIIKTPDHTCAIALQSDPTKVVTLLKLKMLFDSSRTKKEIITSCFDPEVKALLDAQENKLVAVGETGKFLNSFRGNDSVNTYSHDRTVRGIWADKVLAMRSLYNRTSSRENNDEDHMALVDHPLIAAKVQNIIRHITLGEALDKPNAFKTEKGESFYLPYSLSNEEQADQMSDSFYGLKLALNLPTSGVANINKAILAQVNTVNNDYDTEMRQTVTGLVDYVSVRKYDRMANLDLTRIQALSFLGPENLIVVTKENQIGAELITKINEIQENIDFVRGVEEKLLLKVVEHRLNPAAPETMTDVGEKKFFALPANIQMALINYVGTDLPLEVFTSNFGNEDGPLLKVVFDKSKEDEGKRMVEIAALKETISQTPYADASEDEIKLFSISLEFIQEVASGKENELQSFYTKRLLELKSSN